MSASNGVFLFDDSVCELLLSCLSIDECLKFECVSKQWQRVIFRRQKALTIDYNSELYAVYNLFSESDRNYIIYRSLFERLLKKLSYVADIVICESVDIAVTITDEIIDTITENCRYLKRLHIEGSVAHISDHTWRVFAGECGRALTSISLYGVDHELARALLQLMPNLIDCRLNQINSLVVDASVQKFLPFLANVTAVFGKDVKHFRAFADQYGEQLMKINLIQSSGKTVANFMVKHMFEQFTRFRRLEEIVIELSPTKKTDKTICRGLKCIAHSCPNLRELKIKGVDNTAKVFGFFGVYFYRLQRLTLHFRYKIIEPVVGSVKFLKCCPNLINLNISAGDVRDDFFADIHLYAPKLRAIKLICYQRISDKTLESFAKLQSLYSIEMLNQTAIITDSGLRHFIDNCPNIRKIKSIWEISMTKTTIDRFIKRANRRPKLDYLLSCDLPPNSFAKKDLKAIIESLPNNVQFDVKVKEVQNVKQETKTEKKK